MTPRSMATPLVLCFALGCGGADDSSADEPVAVSAGAEADDPMAAGASQIPVEGDCRTEAEIAPVADGDTVPAPSDVASAPADAELTASGLASRRLIRGCGTEHPTEDSRVTVHYTGWTTDGAMFDSSVVRGQAATFPLSGVIPGWTEGVQLMTIGEKRRFWIPGPLAYGNNPRPGAPAGMLVFDVELIAIE